MKNTWKQIFALCLSLVMVAALCPVSPVAAAAGDLTETGIVLWEDDFSQYTDINDVDAKYGDDVAGAERYLENGALYIGSDSSTSNKVYQFDVPVDIPKSYTNMTFYVLCEAEISAPTRQYLFNMNRYWAVGSSEDVKPDLKSGTINATTNGYEKVVLKYSFGVVNDVGTLKMRLGANKNTTGYISIKNIKITLLPAEGTYEGADLNTAMAYDDAYAKLPSDMTVDGDLVLGKNAVLDLNGKTFTADSISVPNNAKIVDSSAAKTGKIVVDEDKLAFANPDYPLLPLWTGDGYIFTEPEMGDTRAFFVDGSVSADGFTLDFRPGFGEVGGQNVRETYLENGACGITMTARLSWTDIYGTSDSVDLGCDNIFAEMYRSAKHRGRLSLIGATEYQTISLGITLASCGVQKSFNTPTFSNEDRVTVHVADYNTENLAIESGKGETIAFEKPIAAANGGKLVLDFNVQRTETTSNRFAFRLIPADEYRASTSGYVGLFGVKLDGQNLKDTCDVTFYKDNNPLETTESVNFRMEVDMANGQWAAYKDGVQTDSGVYPQDGYTTTAAQILNGIDSMVLRVQDGGTHTFSNVAMYSIKTGA